MVSRSRSSVYLATAALVAVALGCGSSEPDLANGKRLFLGDVPKDYKEKNANYTPCASCHALERAGAAGGQGPDLDTAFAQSRADGMTQSTVQGVVHDQINAPLRNSTMMADIVEGDDARDVAAYVAKVAGQPGKDTGELALIPSVEETGPIAAKNGVLTIPANEQGRLLFASDKATAPAGALDIVMPNPSPLPHNIALKGGETGPVVQTGGESRISPTLKPGKYTYVCTVPGHEEGGMIGELTVE